MSEMLVGYSRTPEDGLVANKIDRTNTSYLYVINLESSH